jgi:hypothetical protein
MTENGKTTGINIRKSLPVIVIIIGIIIFSSLYLWNNNRDERPEDNLDKIEFTLIKENTYDFENTSISWQLKNVGDNTFNFSYPLLEVNLHLYIKAVNGTIYRYSTILGSTMWPLYISMSPGEIKEGVTPEGLFRIYNLNYLNYSKNVSFWQNQTTGEYWYFETGTYEIFGEYESYAPYNDSIEDAIIGIWQSNVIEFTIE